MARGLNFAITPQNIPYEEFIVATEIACQKITNQGDKAELRNKVAGILKSAKMSHKTPMKGWKATQSIANDKTIQVLPADKGRTTVTMDTEQYEKQMMSMSHAGGQNHI